MYTEEQHELLKAATKILRSKRCVFSGYGPCHGPIIRAHTVPKGLGLKALAEEGLVYSYDLKPYPNPGKRGMAKIGINQVSTFNFACKKHDNDLFKKIESGNLEINDHTSRLFFLRSVGQETYEIQNQKEFAKLYPLMQSQQFLLAISAKEKDTTHFFDLAKSEDMKIKYCCLNYSEPLPFLATTAYSPFISLNGDILFESSNTDEVAPIIVINVFNYEGKGTILFSWPDECDPVCGEFMRGLLTQSHKTDFILNFLFTNTQNLILNISFFEKLPPADRDYLIDIYRFNIDPSHKNVKRTPTIQFALKEFESLKTNAGSVALVQY
jgi:hypothetical protein